MDSRSGNGRCSFEIEDKADSAKVADMPEAEAGKMSDVIGEAKAATNAWGYGYSIA